MHTTNPGVTFATRPWSTTPSPLAMDPGTFYALGMLALEIATEYLAELPGQQVFLISLSAISCRMRWAISIKASPPG